MVWNQNYLFIVTSRAWTHPILADVFVLPHSTLFPQLMKLSDKDIVEMIFFPVVNEACRVLDEGIALKASDLDVASIMGMGFPSYRSNCPPLNPNSQCFSFTCLS